MRHEFQFSWICSLDESMSEWANKYSCPGFMYFLRKPWPLGNKYHTICCSETNIMFHMEQVERKNEPRQRHKPWTPSEKGRTVGLVLRMTESLHGSGAVFIKDSGFAVAEAEAELARLGCYGSFVAKIRRYWPKHVPGAEIQAFFQNLEPGTLAIRKDNLKGIDIFLHCMKEPDYVAICITSYGTTSRDGKDQTRKAAVGDEEQRVFRFKYPEISSNHYKYRGSVDYHNSLRMHSVAIEEQWRTCRWPIRVFQFVLAVTEVNANLVRHHMYQQEEQQKF